MPAARVVEPERRAHRLRSGKVTVLHAPCPDVFTEDSCAQAFTEFALQADVGAGGVVLANQRPEQDITDLVSGNQGCLAPRAPDGELNFCGGITRVQITLGKRSRLAHRTASERNPVEECARRYVQNLTEKILV